MHTLYTGQRERKRAESQSVSMRNYYINDWKKFVFIIPLDLPFPGIEQALILFHFTEDGAIFTFGRNIDGQVSILFNLSLLHQSK